MSKKVTVQERKQQADRIHQSFYDYSLWPDNATLQTSVPIVCPVHGTFYQTLKNHIVNKHGCRKCHNQRVGETRQITTSQYKARCQHIHNNFFSYEQWPENVKSDDKVSIVCPFHGTFNQRLSQHLRGEGCPDCKRKTLSTTNKKSLSELIEKAKQKHNHQYDYSLITENVTTDQKVSIICKKHGPFSITFNAHLNGQGCRQCATEKTIRTNNHRYGSHYPSQTHIDSESLRKLNDKQWLYQQHYINQRHLIDIADQLNVGDTTVARYLNKHGLQTQHFFVSSHERTLVEWLQAILPNEQIETNTRSVIPPYEIDIFIPYFNLAIEYCGLYWHSDHFKDKNYHLNKLQHCNKQGIQLITLFDCYWRYQPDKVKDYLMHKINKTPNTIYARNCSIAQITNNAKKKKFLENNHLLGNGRGSITYGLFNQDQLVSIMTFIANKDGTLILNRFCNQQFTNIPGAFNKLLKQTVKQHQPQKIVTFADLCWGEGSIYKKAGFTVDKQLKPDYAYSPDGYRLFHKSLFRRQFLQTKLDTFDQNLSEYQNCKNNNILRIWDCGKIRYCYYPQQ